MTTCRRCSEEVDGSFRYCPWCAAPLRIKVTELFPSRPREGEEGGALRVSRYFADDERDGEVRVSVWRDMERGGMRADAAISLDESEAERLGRFLAEAPAADGAPTL